MEKRTLRSSTRAAAQAAAATSTPDDDINTDASPIVSGGAGSSGGGRHKALYKPNPVAKTAQEGVNKRVKEDARLRKQRRDELVSAKRFKRSKETEERTDGGNIEEPVPLLEFFL